MKYIRFYLILIFSCFLANQSLNADGNWDEARKNPRKYLAKLKETDEDNLGPIADRESVFKEIYKFHAQKTALPYEGEIKSWENLCRMVFYSNGHDLPRLKELLESAVTEGKTKCKSRHPGKLRIQNQIAENEIRERLDQLNVIRGNLMERSIFECSKYFDNVVSHQLVRQAFIGSPQERHNAMRLLKALWYDNLIPHLNVWNNICGDALEATYPEDESFCAGLTSSLDRTNLLTAVEADTVREKIKADPRQVHDWFANLGYNLDPIYTEAELASIDKELRQYISNNSLDERDAFMLPIHRARKVREYKQNLVNDFKPDRIVYGVLLKLLSEG